MLRICPTGHTQNVSYKCNMTKLKSLIIFFTLILFSCTGNNEKDETNDELTFGHLVDIEELDEVKMSNNSGTFNLGDKQIEKIKDELSQMTYDPNISVKVGAINIELIIDGKTYNISSATHGDYVEVPKEIVTKNKKLIGTSGWLYFKTNGVNFDNYKYENQ